MILILLLGDLCPRGLGQESQAAPAPQVQTGDSQRIEYREGAQVRGPATERRLALVFTGHEFAEGGTVILDALAARHVKASFFLTGDFLRNPEFSSLVRRMVADGHYVGPHSDKHLLYCSWGTPRTTLVSQSEFTADVENNCQELARFGVARKQMRFFLPAFEHHNREIVEWSRRLGFTLVNLTPGTRSAADYTLESESNFVPSATILESILKRETSDPAGLNGFLLLLHVGAGPGRTDKMHHRFAALLDELQKRGYSFARVDELLSSDPLVHLRVNGVGYRSRDLKLGLAFGTGPMPEQFEVVSVESGRQVFAGRTRLQQEGTWGRFNRFAELDFTALQKPGRYFIRMKNSESLSFTVGEGSLVSLPDTLLEFMRQQRCGFNPWLNTNCHGFDGRTAEGPLPYGSPLDACGGWHDAADLLKYLLTSGNATAQMLLAWELHRGQSQDQAGTLFSDRVNDLGLPGTNGVPDILDEARWGLRWMLKLHPAKDQLYHQVADDRDHCGWRLPQNEQANYGWGKGSNRVVYFATGKPQGLGRYQSESSGVANLAGRYAAAMALAYQIWKDDPQQVAFARQCLTAGEEVYRLGRAKEGVQQGNSYSAPYRYAETTWADDMEWGAAELYRATGRKKYLTDAKRYARLAGAESWMGRKETGHYQYYPFFNAGHFRLHGLVERNMQKDLEGWYREGIERCRVASEQNPFGIGVPFIWCSNNLLAALVTQSLFYERMSGDARYREFAARHRDWLLGRNPWGMTMFTGVGVNAPRNVHLMTTRLTGRSVRGGLVDGPVYERIFQSLKGVTLTESDPMAEFQDPRAVYHDDLHDYSSNEPTMDGTASAILMWSAINSD